MSNLNENLRIVSVREMMVERLAIPNYQRPYRWGTCLLYTSPSPRDA